MSPDDAKDEGTRIGLQELDENVPCGYHSVGPDGMILQMNATALAWLGFTHEELIGKRRFAELVCQHSVGDYARTFEALRAGTDIAELEIEMVRKDGSTFDAFLRIGAVRDPLGQLLCTRATTIDITERKRAETETRLYARQLQAISRRVVEIQESERRLLSAELHDRLGQDLAIINLNLHILKDQLSAPARSRAGSRLDDTIALVERAVEAVRDVAGSLRPLALDDYGLAATLRPYGEQFAKRTGICVVFAADQPIPRLPPQAEMALFRVGQEALTNILKHAGATEVRMTLALDGDRVGLSIADNGRGFAPPALGSRPGDGLGLLIMQERLSAVGGTLRIDSRPGHGTRVTARVRRLP